MALIFVLDASAMLAFLRDEPGADEVGEILGDSEAISIAHSINWCEIYYSLIGERDELAASEAVAGLRRLGVVDRSDPDPDLWRRAAQIKTGGRISLADCLCLALAEKVAGSTVTSDRREFGPLGDRVTSPSKFIR